MLNDEQKELVKNTVPVLKENGVALTDYFYRRMLKNNPDLKETFNMGNQRSGAQAKALAGAVLAYAENIEDPSVLAPVIELVCNKHVSLNIQAPDYAIVGENLLYSISEVLNIAMEDPLIAAWGEAYQQLADIFIATEKTLYEKHKTTDGSWLGWREFVVDKKVKESNEISSFYLIPKDNQAIPVYKAGQYISLRVYVPELGIKQPRQYSLSDAPSGKYLRISVKREDARIAGQDPGYVSSTLHNAVAAGDIIEASAPTGNFYLINPQANNVLISAGIGLTPMLAMLKQITEENICSDKSEDHRENTNWIYFLHAARSSKTQALRNELSALANKNPKLRTYVALENVDPDEVLGRDYHLQGRLDLKQVPNSYLPKDADYYLCGPLPFMRQQNHSLLELGVPQERIHSEAFGTGGVSL